MSKYIEPPAFIGDNISYAEYRKDIMRWSRICGLDKKVMAETIVYNYENHPSRIKEKINTQIGDKLVDNENGLQELLTFLDGIYTRKIVWLTRGTSFANFHIS